MKKTNIINNSFYTLFIALLIAFIPACQKDEGISSTPASSASSRNLVDPLFSSLSIDVEQSLGQNSTARVLETLRVTVDGSVVEAQFAEAIETDFQDNSDELYQFYRFYELQEDSLLNARIGVSILINKETREIEVDKVTGQFFAFVQVTVFDSAYQVGGRNPGVFYALQADGLQSVDYSFENFTFDFDYDGKGTGKYRGPEKGRDLFPPSIDIALNIVATQ